MLHKITEGLKNHYTETFQKFGATSKGVDWGKDEEVLLRYQKMFAVIRAENSHDSRPSLLDVGCGYGGLLTFAQQENIDVEYTGIDVVEDMIKYAQSNFQQTGSFHCKDIFQLSSTNKKYDYVVCNGVLTQKLSASIKDMDHFAQDFILKMFEMCNIGIAFNIMTNKVNFMVDNLYYKSPTEMLAFCLSNVCDKVQLDHSYKLYEYTTYLYKS